MADTRQFESTNPSASSDDEIVAALQRLAHAQALLFQAENDVSSPGEDAARLGDRNREIEEAHTKLLWTQAETLTAPRGERTPKTLEPHRKREQQALAKFGFSSFDQYLDDRARRPTNNINLAKARREYRAAHEHWEDVLRSKGASEFVAPPSRPAPPATAAPAFGSSSPAYTEPPTPAASFGGSSSSSSSTYARSEGLSPPARMALAALAVGILLLTAFLVMKTRSPSSADAALATAPTLPVTLTTARATPPINSIPTKPVTGPASSVAPGAPTTAKVAPTTVAPKPAATTPAPTPTTAATANRTAALCAAAKVFTLDDLVGLGERAVADPKAMLQAYEAMALTAPANLTPHMQALGPLTREAITQVQQGNIKTPGELQQWLAAAPTAQLEQWINAQLTLIPAIQEICAGA